MDNLDDSIIEKCRKYVKIIAKDRNNKIRHDKSIRAELEKIQGLNDKILDKADEINKSMTIGTKRSDSRVLCKTYLINCALEELDIPFNPSKLANLIPGTNRKKVIKKKKKKNDKRAISYLATASSKYSAIQTGYEAPFRAYDPRMYVILFCHSFDFTSDLSDDIIKFSKRILIKAPALFSDSPIKIASGLIYYYVNSHGININPESIENIAGISPATMSDIYNKINKIDNSI